LWMWFVDVVCGRSGDCGCRYCDKGWASDVKDIGDDL
jgi:hypothetical protein